MLYTNKLAVDMLYAKPIQTKGVMGRASQRNGLLKQLMRGVPLLAWTHPHQCILDSRPSFPIGIDAHRNGQTVPETMQAYKLRGTPSLILIDKRGVVREILFGQVDELALGVAIGKMMAE